MDVFQAAQVEKVTGVSRAVQETWIKAGFISPSVQKAEGHGTRNLWSRWDLYKIHLFRRLVNSGIRREAAAKIIASVAPRVRSRQMPEDGEGSGILWLLRQSDGEVMAVFWDGRERPIDEFIRFWEEFLSRGKEQRVEIEDMIVIPLTRLTDAVDVKVRELGLEE